MDCPFCGCEMHTGEVRGDMMISVDKDTGVFWCRSDRTKLQKIFDADKRLLTDNKNILGYRIPAHYCSKCKKVILDAEVEDLV